MSVLVTGGAGYIGSHMVLALLDHGEDVVVIDNLSTGVRGLVDDRARLIIGDISDKQLVRNAAIENRVNAVLHFAGSVVVPESVENPILYYSNNTAASLSLIEVCRDVGIGHFVFSSTAAVYGSPAETIVTEETLKSPINPYGRSKLITEWMLADVSAASDFRYTALRYFNVAGADPQGRTGQSTPRATHLIKRACQVALGLVPRLDIFGKDFDTPDGTGVRDYIHVTDLINAHLLALKALRQGADSDIYNCGYGRGLSVREIVSAVEKLTGRRLPTNEMTRRAGDPAMLIANANKIMKSLSWAPEHADIYGIVASALAWEKTIK